MAPAGSIVFSEEARELDAASFRQFNALFHLLVYQELIAGAALIAFTSVVVLRSGVLPRWAGLVGLLVAFATAVLVWQVDIPLLLLLLWVLILSALVLRTAPPGRSAAET